MNSFRKRLKLLAVGMTASLVAFSSLILLIPTPVAAAAVDYNSLPAMDKATIFLSVKAAQSQECLFEQGVSAADINSGKWFQNQPVTIGHLVEPNDGKISCQNENNWFSNLLTKAGFAGNLGAAADQIFEPCTGRLAPNFCPKANSKAAFNTMIGTALFGGTIPNASTDDVTYAALFRAFTADSACGGKPGSGAGNTANIPIISGTTVTPTPYTYNDNTGAIGVGYGINVPGAGNDPELECSSIVAYLEDAKFANAVVAAGTGLDSTDGSTADADPSLECDFKVKNPLTWIMCPIIKGINQMVNALDNLIIRMLTIDQAAIFDRNNETGSRYYAAWQSFRSFALAILVIAAIAMVIAQALGFEILDAYAIKKLLPRLIISIIAIALSWEIMHFFVIVINDLGLGIRNIIYLPFDNFAAPGISDIGASLAIHLLTGAALVALGPVGLLSFAGTALLAIAVAVLVLVVRQLVIIVLILFAPIAIACFILPNTNGVWKIWYESFTKAMMMFPIIVAFLAVGRVFAITATTASFSDIPAIGQIIGFAAYFLPYFLLPLTFRFAGGAMRTLGGMTNDRSRGGFDRLRKYRGEQTAKNVQGLKTGNRYSQNTRLSRGFNSATNAIATAPAGGLNPRNMRSRYVAARTEQTFNEAEEIRTKNAAFAAGAQDDRLLKAAQHGQGRAGIRKYLSETEGMSGAELDTAVGTVERMQSSGSQEAVKAAVAIQRFATGTGYNNAAGEFDYQEAMETIRDASGGDRALGGRLLGTAKGVSGQAGQLAFGGASYGTLSKGLDQAYAGPGVAVDGEAIARNAFEGNDAVSITRARAPHVKAMVTAVNKRIEALSNGATPTYDGEIGRLTAQLESFQQTANMYAAPERQNVIVQQSEISETARTQVHREAGAHANTVSTVQNFPSYDINTRQRVEPPAAPANVDQLNRYRNARQADPNDPRLPPRDEH